MLDGRFKITRQMYRSLCEQQQLHWRLCIELIQMMNSTVKKNIFDGHACETVVERGQVS